MKLIFSDDAFPTEVTKSIFLEGPSPRSAKYEDWKPRALEELAALNFNGTVFIPVPRARFYAFADDSATWTYDGQVEWECTARQRADAIFCWLDRVIDASDDDLGMPGFTTNVEFGEDLNSGKMTFGRPDTAAKSRYLEQRVNMLGREVHNTLTAALSAVVTELGEGCYRQGGEVCVPLFIWTTEQFQSWYSTLKAAGNRLDGAKLLHHVRMRAGPVFFYTMSVNVWVAAEKRNKTNEFLVARKDLSAVVAYTKDSETGAVKVALIKEFRSPVNNATGFVHELPSGSSAKADVDPLENAQHELDEETGLHIADVSRFKLVRARQLVATFSTHKAHVFSIRLTSEEMAQLEATAKENTAFGAGESEMTFVMVVSLADIFTLPVDYSTLGMIFEAVNAD